MLYPNSRHLMPNSLMMVANMMVVKLMKSM